MGNRLYLMGFWILWIVATVWMVTGRTDDALWSLGSAILFRLFWQETRD